MGEDRINELKIEEEITGRITTTIPKDIKDYIKRNGYKYNELLRLGIMAKENNPQMIDRIRILENRNEVIERRLEYIIDKIKEVLNELQRRE